jgi:hypothetical protein
MYEFKIDSFSDAVEELTYCVRFGGYDRVRRRHLRLQRKSTVEGEDGSRPWAGKAAIRSGLSRTC